MKTVFSKVICAVCIFTACSNSNRSEEVTITDSGQFNSETLTESVQLESETTNYSENTSHKIITFKEDEDKNVNQPNSNNFSQQHFHSYWKERYMINDESGVISKLNEENVDIEITTNKDLTTIGYKKYYFKENYEGKYNEGGGLSWLAVNENDKEYLIQIIHEENLKYIIKVSWQFQTGLKGQDVYYCKKI